MKTNHFDINNSPLKGTNLIEASAGTGKTYTITGIFLRLIIEENSDPDKILVVTFTNAATNELKQRIRTRLSQALDIFLSGNTKNNEDIFLTGLFQKNRDKAPKIILKLKQAIRDFDQASIFTIHGFCQRMLSEYAFESRAQFDAQLVSDEDRIKREVIEDFWRINLYNEPPVFARYARSVISIDKLFQLINSRTLSPEIRIIPEPEICDSSHFEENFTKYHKKLKKIWESEKDEIKDIFLSHKSLNRNKYRKNSVLKITALMDEYLGSEPDVNIFDEFVKFTGTYIKKAVKKGKKPPCHDFFIECENFYNIANALKAKFDKKILKLKFSLFQYVKKKLKAKKEALNIKSFDDLIIDFYEALKDKKTGNNLAKAIRKRYKAALIDEFQDTDPIQYEIFKKIFMSENSLVFLIGDPKQAIYGFRGADIFAYMDASSYISEKYTLSTNWRSHKKLIKAINTVFNANPAPFLYEKIGFEPVLPAPQKAINPYDDMAGLTIWLNSPSPDGKERAVNKGEAKKAVINSMVCEISRLVNKGIEPEDIAVLVRKNMEAEMVSSALSRINIPSVICNVGHVFETWEAIEMMILLCAISNPKDEKAICTALGTYIGGYSGDELARLKNNESEWENIVEKFFEYRAIWQSKGFFRMFREFMKRENLLPRIMSLDFGQRRATNILHIAELLHQAEVEKGLKMQGLVKWLADQKDAGKEHPEEHLIRLETDDKAVQILTIHKSKGLEFPIVFCPFIWDGSKIGKNAEPLFFHNKNRKPVVDLGSHNIDANRKIAEKEILAENIRLFYVGLTRAKARAYLAWGKINKAGTSAPAHIFHNLCDSDDISDMEKKFAKISTDSIVNDIENLAKKSQGAIEVTDLPFYEAKAFYEPDSQKEEELSCPDFNVNLEKNFEIASYSSLVSGGHKRGGWDEWEISEYDILQNKENENPNIFSFPKGAGPGTCLHEIFENISFTKPDSSQNIFAIEKILEKYAISPDMWKETIFNMVINVLSAPLEGIGGKFSLSQIKKEKRIHEMGFYFPVENSLSAKKLEKIFSLLGQRFGFSAFKGFMTGFIDLVFTIDDKFYIIDWKSNYLGKLHKDYAPEKLYDAMDKASYFLQYHIYALALHKYLALKIADYDYEKYFGGVFYLFLRGIDPCKNPEYGIFKDRPCLKIIKALDKVLQEG